jgi:methyltransferase (TIGR00027 family)
MLDPVAKTGLLVAALRADESLRPDRLFDDPFAATLATDEGRALLGAYRALGPSIPIIEVRTRFYDEALLRAPTAQVVLLAAGMDARAYRLPWPSGTRLFEVDRPEVIAAKDQALAGTAPRCQRTAVAADLAGDWPRLLASGGFDRAVPTSWLVEGLLQYLDPATVDLLFARIDALSAPGSRLVYDVVGRRLFEAPFLAPLRDFMAGLGAPWRHASDEPAAPVSSRGWRVAVTDPARIGNEWGRWPFPAAAPDAPAVPRGYLIEATKGEAVR